MEESTNICRLCLKIVGKDVPFFPLVNNSAVLQNLNLISFVTIKNLQLTENPIICNICNKTLKELAVLKENIITNEFQLQCHERKDLNSFLESLSDDCEKICRLCLKSCENPSKIQKDWKDKRKIFSKCNIHLNLNIPKPTKICNKCDLALQDMWNFVSVCLEIEKQIVDCATQKGKLTNNDLLVISLSKGKKYVKKSATVDDNNLKKVGEPSGTHSTQSAKLNTKNMKNGDYSAEKRRTNNKSCFQSKEKSEKHFSSKNPSREIEDKPTTSKAGTNLKERREKLKTDEDEHLVINRTPRTYSNGKLRSHKVKVPLPKINILSEICIKKESKPSTSKASNDSEVVANKSIDASPGNVADITWDIGLDMESSRIIEVESRGLRKDNVTQELIEILKVTEESLITIEKKKSFKCKDKYKDADEVLKVLEDDGTDQKKYVKKQQSDEGIKKESPETLSTKDVIQNIIQEHSDILMAQKSSENQKILSVIEVEKKIPTTLSKKKAIKKASGMLKSRKTVQNQTIQSVKTFKNNSPETLAAENLYETNSDNPKDIKTQKTQSVKGIREKASEILPTTSVIQKHSDRLIAQKSGENQKILSVVQIQKKSPATLSVKKAVEGASSMLQEKKTVAGQQLSKCSVNKTINAQVENHIKPNLRQKSIKDMFKGKTPRKKEPEATETASKVVPESTSCTDEVKEQNINLEQGDSSENTSVHPRPIRKRAVGRGGKIKVKEQESEISSEKQVLKPNKGASTGELTKDQEVGPEKSSDVAAGGKPHELKVTETRTRSKRVIRKQANLEGGETAVPKKRMKKSSLKSVKLSTNAAHLEHAINETTSSIAQKPDVSKHEPESKEASSLNGQESDPEASDSDSSSVGLLKDKPVVVTIIRRKKTTNKANLDKTWMELTGKKGAEASTEEAPIKKKRGRPRLPEELRKPERPKPVYIHCPSCAFKSISQDMFIQHQLIHNVVDNLGQFRCGQCSFRTTTKELLLQHEATTHVPILLMFKCAFCEYSSKKKVSTMNHTLRHDDKDISSMFYCLVANLMTEEEYYECFQCLFQSAEESVMPDHVIEHQVEEIHNPILYKFSCSKCSYKTKTESFYKRHLELHEEDKKRDWARKYVKREEPEEEVVNFDIVYPCPLCPYSTKNKRSLTNHKARHKPPRKSNRKDETTQNLYQCNECSYTACRKPYLVRHMLLHRSKENIEFFECPHCLFETKHRRSYTRHMEVRHKLIV